MNTRFVGLAILLMLCLTVSLARGQRGERGGGRSRGGMSFGGQWSERSHQGGSRNERQGSSDSQRGSRGGNEGGFGRQDGGSTSDRSQEPTSRGERGANQRPQASGAQGAAAGNRSSSQYSGAQGAAAANRNQPQASGAQGAAAANRNSPQYSGAQGAAAANRSSPQYSGAQGAAAANRNSPQYSGAQGAAAANRNAPTYSGAQGAAAGAAAANRRQPQYSGAQGAAAGAAVANRNAPTYSGAQGAAAGAAVANRYGAVVPAGGSAAAYSAVSNSFNQPGMYGDEWYVRHATAWKPDSWTAGAAWTAPKWGAIASHLGYGSNPPAYYDYGENVTSQNNNVVMNGQNVGTTEAFGQQAAHLAERGTAAQESTDDKWLPVGVFALVRNETQHPQLIVQLAINKQGILRGNYTDDATDHTLPIHGALDEQTQRVAFTVGDNRNSVLEAGLGNLMEGAAPALIHKNGKTDHWLLVRLQQLLDDRLQAPQ